MKLIDGFVFYNELGLLKYRLDTLYEIVDNFILVESTKTFSGNSKELFYEKNKHLYEKYQDKIIHIIVDDM
jgi:beta-1,4-mannosyl-glycoprotein beta-1,4-N-acetylglucosaminyltransferase